MVRQTVGEAFSAEPAVCLPSEGDASQRFDGRAVALTEHFPQNALRRGGTGIAKGSDI